MSDEFVIPPGLEAGVYADVFAVWHTPHAFVLDFAAVDPVEATHMVARVRIPIGLVFGLLQAISARMEEYEHEFGEIHAPRHRGDDGEEKES